MWKKKWDKVQVSLYRYRFPHSGDWNGWFFSRHGAWCGRMVWYFWNSQNSFFCERWIPCGEKQKSAGKVQGWSWRKNHPRICWLETQMLFNPNRGSEKHQKSQRNEKECNKIPHASRFQRCSFWKRLSTAWKCFPAITFSWNFYWNHQESCSFRRRWQKSCPERWSGNFGIGTLEAWSLTFCAKFFVFLKMKFSIQEEGQEKTKSFSLSKKPSSANWDSVQSHFASSQLCWIQVCATGWQKSVLDTERRNRAFHPGWWRRFFHRGRNPRDLWTFPHSFLQSTPEEKKLTSWIRRRNLMKSLGNQINLVSRGVAVVDFDLIVASFFLPGGWCVIFAINIGM